MKLFATLLAVLAFGPDAAAVTGSGLRGTVFRGPTTPVCRIGVPCSEPAAGARLTFVRGDARRTTTTDADGHYRIALAPGTYTVRIANAKFGYSPQSAYVPTGRWAVRNFQIDTGIR
jgi:Carboxypeptidase regulatory-like domain